MIGPTVTVRQARAIEGERAALAVTTLRRQLAAHLPLQPSWDCDTCPAATAWPCPPARVTLAERYRHHRDALSMLAGGLLSAALVDRATDQPADLVDRMLRWTW